uniref:FxSxx-COOH system tetratricopeptide repeat protein n=1 Tax=Streptomyces sp. SBT349 TaxID=1580539 RepID=UPI00066ACCC2
GMGGVGKTQLAAGYARTAWQLGSDPGGLDVLVWISATSREGLVAGYAQAGEELCGADPGDAERAARTFLAWLQPKAGAPACRWLIVLDDLTDPAHVRDLWPPASPTGRTLVTTRRRDAAMADRGRVVTVGLFTATEAVAFLTDALAHRGRGEPDNELAGLAHDLGYLPLALSQAAAYLTDTLLTCAAYRTLLGDRKRKLADLVPEHGALPDDQTATLAAGWALSIDRADTLRPAGLARPMLHVAAMLDPNGIPEAVLTSRPTLAYLTEHRTPTGGDQQPPPASAEDAVLALRALHRLSLVDHTRDTPHQAVRVHQLIQRATRDALAPQAYEEAARAAADALTESWPESADAQPLGRILRSNADALSNHAQDALCSADEAHPVLFRTGNSLGHAGQITAAIAHFRNLVHAVLGSGHPYGLAARRSSAHWLGKGGDEAGAVAIIEEFLPDLVRLLGPHHPDTLAARSDVAGWRGLAGDVTGAVMNYQELVRDMARVLGAEHPHTLAARANLARNRGLAGDAAGAADAFAKLLADRIRVQGPDHRGTLVTRRELARLLGETEDPAAAENAREQLEALLADCVRVLGADHPDTLTTRKYLAHVRGGAGNATDAVTSYEELLPDLVRVLGPHHPETLAARSDLASKRGEAGDAAGAVAAYEGLLPDAVQALGADHRGTLITRAGLAYWRGKAGDATGAVAAYEDLLTDMVRVLGADHPTTLNNRGNLAHWRGEAGDAALAAADFARLLPDLVRVLGGRHPRTRVARNNLAHWQHEARSEVPRAFRREI